MVTLLGQNILRYQWVHLGEHVLQYPVKRLAQPAIPVRLLTHAWRGGSEANTRSLCSLNPLPVTQELVFSENVIYKRKNGGIP